MGEENLSAEPSVLASSTPPAPKPVKPQIAYVSAAGDTLPGPAGALGIRITTTQGEWQYTFTEGKVDLERLFALFGALMLASQVVKKANAPLAEAQARFARVTDHTWGDEKPTKTKRDPLAELLDVIRTCKERAGDTFDETAVRAKLADPKVRLAAKKIPEVAAELLRRKTGTAVAALPGLASL